MIDLNTLLSNTLQQALDQTLLPYRERIATLEDSNEALKITIQNLQLSLAKLATDIHTLTNRATPTSASTLTEDRVRVIATEVVDDHLYRHTLDFDHDPLNDIKKTMQDIVDEAVKDIDEQFVKDILNDLLQEASISISI